MTQLEVALTNIIGKWSPYMRPPYLSYNQAVLNTLGSLGYYVIIGNLNTKDWAYQTQSGIETSKQLFLDGLANGGSISEAHDPEYWTQGVLIDFMISTIQSRGLTSKNETFPPYCCC